MKARVSLAWCNLTHDWVRLGLFAAGVGFAVTLMFVQNGFRHALLDSNVLLIEQLNADLILVGRRQATLVAPDAFAAAELHQARGVPGVGDVQPLYLETRISSLRHAAPQSTARQPTRSIRVLGIDPLASPIAIPEVLASSAELRLHGRALADSAGKPVFGPLQAGSVTELDGQRIDVVGTFPLGSDFGAEGTLIVSRETFIDLLRRPYGQSGDRVELGLIRLEPGAARAPVRDRLRQLFAYHDIDVLTKAELMERERGFWLRSTPIGYVFGLGLGIGFVVGMVICYQILSSEVADHLPEYATLKAIGYSNAYLSLVVLQEALLLAVFGFLPGLAVSEALFVYLAGMTSLPMRLTLPRILFILGLTIIMCVASGLIALRKVQEVDPAEVF